jgi:hypothetical protein
MSFLRLVLLAIVLPLLLGACGAPVAVTAASYGADGVSLVETGKSTSDHFISMVSKKDCAMWRVLRGRDICKARKDGRDPYDVNYDEANRLPSEDGVSYAPPLDAAPDAPATSWNAEAYAKPAPDAELPQAATPPEEPAPVVADVSPLPPVAVSKPAKSAKSGKSAKKKKPKVPVVHAKAAVRKPSPGQAATVP